MYTLKRAYAEYLLTQVADSVLEEDLCIGNYLCWSIPHEEEYTIYNWLGKVVGDGITRSRRYVWLGNKGAVYVTKSPKLEKQVSDTNIVLNMKKWVWKKHYSIDL